MYRHKHLISIISRYRAALMGVAMLLVLIYHGPALPYGNRFVIGYIGVDIFLFLSGMGLCYSYGRNTLRHFYSKRLMRILPAMVLMYLLIDVVNGDYNVLHMLSQITTFNFYTSNPNPDDWYLPALMLLYALFPLLYKCVGRTRRWSLLVYPLSACIILIYSQLEGGGNWQHHCLLGRIPIFVLGIATFYGYGMSLGIRAFLALLGAYVWYSFHIYLGTAMMAPLLMDLLMYLFRRMPKFILSAFESIGCYTLEIYCANVLAGAIYSTCLPHIDWQLGTIGSLIANFTYYVVYNSVCIFAFIFANKVIQKVLALKH